ncbi:KOW domain-containing protein domain-containing protein [Phlyctema vagabunda]|uniref:KOW domain-containing protein domain-containing protein n=1 Tax=Phlyctema vagabunda TaxID=108571 RepID=A0ABR4PWK8_9HELO
MQQIIKRTAQAEKHAARRLARRKDKLLRDWTKSRREQIQFGRKDETDKIQEARAVRREDYELGPLAPRRDVGDLKETYGTINAQRTRGQPLKGDELDVLKTVGGRYLNIVTGDRVVLLEGRDKGKIGEITATDAKRNQCTVKGLNVIDVAVPEWMLQGDDQDKRPVRSMEQPVPLNKVKLVYPLPDPETGMVRDVIVKKLVNSKIWHDRHTGRTSWSRIIPGLDIKVPWPKKEPKEHKDNAADTLRVDVETKTFIPTLLRPPMPSSVIDELRNKYSVFRTRHDAEYIEAKRLEDVAKEEKLKMAKEMRTPLREANRKARKLRKAKGRGALTPQMLEKIGEVIAKRRGLALEAAGISRVEAEPTTATA